MVDIITIDVSQLLPDFQVACAELCEPDVIPPCIQIVTLDLSGVTSIDELTLKDGTNVLTQTYAVPAGLTDLETDLEAFLNGDGTLDLSATTDELILTITDSTKCFGDIQGTTTFGGGKFNVTGVVIRSYYNIIDISTYKYVCKQNFLGIPDLIIPGNPNNLLAQSPFISPIFEDHLENNGISGDLFVLSVDQFEAVAEITFFYMPSGVAPGSIEMDDNVNCSSVNSYLGYAPMDAFRGKSYTVNLDNFDQIVSLKMIDFSTYPNTNLIDTPQDVDNVNIAQLTQEIKDNLELAYNSISQSFLGDVLVKIDIDNNLEITILGDTSTSQSDLISSLDDLVLSIPVDSGLAISPFTSTGCACF